MERIDKRLDRGIAPAAIILAVVVLLGGVIYFLLQPVEDADSIQEEGVVEKPESSRVTSQSPSAVETKYLGEVLAGNSSPFLNFVKADYDRAQQEGKIIFLYFYATWCPICKAELRDTHAAFNELTTDQVVGFRVNFNDNDTGSDERDLAREFGVAYQHTKVIIKDGQRAGKFPDSWNKERYLSEINKTLVQ